jgi:predicted Fe-Mo cluster-binding NifX family protein
MKHSFSLHPISTPLLNNIIPLNYSSFSIFLPLAHLLLMSTIDMKIAIPIYENRISPRFDFSPEMWIVEVERSKFVGQEKFFTANLNLPQRLEQITSNGVDKLICGGIDSFSRNQLGSRGIDVVQDVIGDAKIVIELFMRGRLRPGLCCEKKKGRVFCPWRRGQK